MSSNNNNTSHAGTAFNKGDNSNKNNNGKHGFRYGSVHSATMSTDPENYEDALLLGEEQSTTSRHRDHGGEYGGNFYSAGGAGSSLRSLSQRATSIRVSMSRSMREFVEKGFVPDGSITVSVRTFEGGATVTSEIANIAKNLIGTYKTCSVFLCMGCSQQWLPRHAFLCDIGGCTHTSSLLSIAT